MWPQVATWISGECLAEIFGNVYGFLSLHQMIKTYFLNALSAVSLQSRHIVALEKLQKVIQGNYVFLTSKISTHLFLSQQKHCDIPL